MPRVPDEGALVENLDRYSVLALARGELEAMAAEYRSEAYNAADNDAGVTRDAAYAEAACDRAAAAIFDAIRAALYLGIAIKEEREGR